MADITYTCHCPKCGDKSGPIVVCGEDDCPLDRQGVDQAAPSTGAPVTCPLCGPAKTGELCEQEGCPLAGDDLRIGGPVYPDLLERLIARATEKYGGSLNMAMRPSLGWYVGFGIISGRDKWYPTFESAALQALAKGEER